MADEKTSTEWRVIGETVPGASHLRAGISNQDAILYLRQSSRALPIILSVSDGHGSAKCFRSDRGSQFAVKKAAYLIGEFLDARRNLSENADASEIESVQNSLAEEFVDDWREAVEADLEKEPFTEEEFENLEKKSGEEAKKYVDENPFLAYGATSLTVAVTKDFIFYMQLGDGEILNISASGEVTKPLAEDARLLANETTSLCLPKAEKDFRFLVQKISAEEDFPALILVSTDGYLNSFSSEAGFFQAGTDILEMLKTSEGFDAVNENLKSWLEESTTMGSGDDCTVAIIYQPEELKKEHAKKEKKEQAEKEELKKADEHEESEQAKRIETTTIELPTSPEMSQAIAALTDSETIAPEHLEDMTVTITIKKDKNKNKTKKASPAAQAPNAPISPAENGEESEDKEIEKEAR